MGLQEHCPAQRAAGEIEGMKNDTRIATMKFSKVALRSAHARRVQRGAGRA